MTTRVALIGANGHGRHHRRYLAGLDSTALVGLADTQPIEPDPPVPDGARVFTGHRELLERTAPDVVIICTPPHTHLAIAEDALHAGADVLLEKPPVRTLAEHRRLAGTVRATGRACQVGFQALGSRAAARLWDSVAQEKVTGLSAVASWQRDDAYYARAPWAGRRSVGGQAVVDGVLVNPLAHALMQCLATAEAAGAGPATELEVERYRTREIEADDTAFARVTFATGLRLLVAVTLAGEDFIAGEVTVDGSAGRAVLEYPTDRLMLPGEPCLVAVDGRTGLLENLIAHRSDPAVPLIAPLSRTESFTGLIEALTAPDLPPPTLLGPPHVETRGGVRVILGINEVLRRAARESALPFEAGVAWAVPPHRRPLEH
ncbi:Gfo/Idh/MocA family protein [Winogradskya humida]|uniref:Oxidoreductase n=1 Tax=Winogradskya humida TaxID=113566 RepID=A0ABQ3ZYY4_9ACTN|nr:Gfo/Idh/MocA family oxidoreductase [Actinoplanes humidus]GIE23362.1 oxidoreductase [Actinoplanes humidus]